MALHRTFQVENQIQYMKYLWIPVEIWVFSEGFCSNTISSVNHLTSEITSGSVELGKYISKP